MSAKKRADRGTKEGLRLLKKILIDARGNVPRILRGYPRIIRIKGRVLRTEVASIPFDGPPNVKVARVLWRLSILSRPGKQKLIRSSRNVCSPYDSSTGDSETRLPDLLFLPGRNSFAPLESSSTATTPAVFRRRRPPNDARMSTAIVVLPPRLRSTHPSSSSSSSSLFLPPLAQAKGIFVSTVGSRGGEGLSSSRFGGTDAGES